jgi:predicted glutamine amidotransferase
MCRLLGVVSATPPRALPELLDGELEPFAALSSVHCDGWGIAHWNDTDDLVVDKAPEAASGSAGFATAAAKARTQAAILHLRKASAGMPTTKANTHPFAAGSVAFAHNGFFSPREKIDAMLDGRGCEGDTDSERYFALVLAEMRHGGPVPALARAASRIAAATEVISLNAMLLTHQALYTFAYYDEKVIAATPGEDLDSYVLRFRPGPDDVIVASNGWDQPAPQWEVLGNGAILEVSRADLRTTVHRNPINRL